MNALTALLEQGQSIWYDFISREFIQSGEMKRLVDLGLRGMTSNPTIFEKAITSGSDYDESIRELVASGNPTAEIATQLFIQDVRDACDVMRPVYDSSGGTDGFISIEVSPLLATKTDDTIVEARRLWRDIDRPNLMVKIPGTTEGLPAIRTCIADGININITLMFSLDQYLEVADAWMSGLEDRVARGESITSINSVASIFVSRIDTMIDALLDKIGTPEAIALRGLTALANTKLVYREFQRLMTSPRWRALADKDATPQRPLWASTSSKNPAYPDLIYVTNLIGPLTVNTLPPETLNALLDHGTIAPSVEEGVNEAEETIAAVRAAGVDLDAVMQKLIDEGVEKFVKSFESLSQRIDEKKGALAEAG
jgi:transaldolase